MQRLIQVIIHWINGKQPLLRTLSPQLRVDTRGSGAFGAGRGGRAHNGIDLLVNEGETIHAPFDMYIERYSKASSNTKTSGIRFSPHSSAEGTHGFIWYFRPYDNVVGGFVRMGEPIGYSQDIANEYGGGMKNHVHIEQWAGSRPINITPYYV